MNSIKNLREESIDALRGFALMGLFLVHMVEYFEIYWFKPEASIYNDITFFLFGGKAYAIFAFLFGLSFFIIMNNQSKNGVDFRKRFSWRLAILLLAGILHGWFYGGDILQILAITGFLLVPLYYLRNIFLFLLAGFFLLQIPALLHLISVLVQDSGANYTPLHWSMYGDVHKTYALGSFMDVIKLNFWQGQIAKWTFMLESGRLSTIMGISILGFIVGRIGIWKDSYLYKNKFRLLFIIALIITTLVNLFESTLINLIAEESRWLGYTFINSLYSFGFTLTLIFGFLFLYQIDVFQKVLKPLAAPGRMSLTVYVFQSIIFVPIFYGFGFGVYDYIGQTLSFYLGIILWVLQVIIANYWIKRYYYGPLEWLWRVATYMNKSIKFKREIKLD